MPTKWHNPTFASIAVFLAAAFWGLFWIPLRYLEDFGVPGIWPAFFMNAPGALVLGIWLATHWEENRKHIGRALVIGIFTGGFGFGLFAVAILYGTVIRVTLLFYLTPIWGTLIGILWLGDRATWARWAAISTGLLGMALLLSGGTSTPLNIGDLFGFITGVSWAIGASMIMRYGAVPVAASAFSQMFMGMVVVLLCGVVLGQMTLPTSGQFVAGTSVGFATSLAMVIPTMLVIVWAQKILFPGRLGLLMMAEVMLAVISASLFIPDETLSAVEWTGAVFIVSACLMEIVLSPSGGKTQDA